MTEFDLFSECSSDVLIEFAESFHIFQELLAVAIVFGVLFGIIAAALLYVYFLKPLLLSRTFQGSGPRRLFETDDLDKDDNQSECISTGRKAGKSNMLCERERKQPPPNSDVAAFALKAKVVYPINQRYRPLADGASNPSLHENGKLGILHNQESSSSSSLESLNQDNDDDSSQFVSSSPIPKTFQNERFIKISSFSETLSCLGFEGRISLYALGLQRFQCLCSELQDEKHVSFLQILRIIFNEWFHKEKTDSAFYSNVLLMQERELKELKKEFSNKPLNANEDPNSVYCTLEEVERAGKDRLEQGLQKAMGFSKQLERLCQQLHGRPGPSSKGSAWETTRTLVRSLLLVESELTEVQTSHMKSTQEKLLWWEELGGWLQSRPVLLKQEAVCRLRLVAKALEQLTSDGQLSFTHMERMLSELQDTLREELQHCTEEYIRLTKDLVNEKARKIDNKKRKLAKVQAKEKSRVLDGVHQYRDPLEFVKGYQELLAKQRKESGDLEEQHEWRVAEAVGELWKGLHSAWSEKLAGRVRELFLSALADQTQLPAERCKELRQDAERDLSAQLRREEAVARQHLEGLRERLGQDRQTWAEEEGLVSASLKHLAEQQLKILRGMLVRQSEVQERGLMEKKQRLLLAAMQRQFMARHLSLKLVKEMRLSRLKLLPMSDPRALELEDCGKTHQLTPSLTPRASHKESGSNESDKRLGPEAQLIGHGFHQEFLSELDTGAELLQEHAQLLVGHSLAQSVRQLGLAQTPTQNHPMLDDKSSRLRLIEAASESVYVTRDSVSALIHSYYAQIQSVTTTLQQDLKQQLQSFGDQCDAQRSRSQLCRSLQKELANWARKPTSSEFQQRVEIQKEKILTHYDFEMEGANEVLRRKKSALDNLGHVLPDRLQDAEETFMVRLAALARVPLQGRETSRTDSHSGEGGLSDWMTAAGVREGETVPQPATTFRYDPGRMAFGR